LPNRPKVAQFNLDILISPTSSLHKVTKLQSVKFKQPGNYQLQTWPPLRTSAHRANPHAKRDRVQKWGAAGCLPHTKMTPKQQLVDSKEFKSGHNQDTCTSMFIAVLFIIAKLWNQPRHPSAGEWIQKMWSIYKTEYYSAIKKNEAVSFAGK
jgi:hypothetical protein